MVAGEQPEQPSIALCHPLAQLVGVAGVLEQMHARRRSEPRVRVPMLARHPHRIEAETDDQQRRERVPERVRRDPVAELRMVGGPFGPGEDETSPGRCSAG